MSIIQWRRPIGITTLLMGVLLASGWQLWWQNHPAVSTDGVKATLQQLPLSFIENKGQVDPKVAYYVQGSTTAIYFTPSGVTFSLSGEQQAASRHSRSPGNTTDVATSERWTLKLDFINANLGVKPQGRSLQTGKISYFKGPESEWQTGVATYGEIVYPELWPGIDLVYSGRVNRLKYHFLVKPGADPSVIKLAYRGATALRLTDEGELVVETPVQTLRDARPVAYQKLDGRRVAVAMDVALSPTAEADAHAYGFRVGDYDRRRPLVLDPAILVYAGYIGGNSNDEGRGIAVDSAGNAYVTGQTLSTEATFPEKVGPDLTHNGPSLDAFVAKVNAAGTGLVYAGYIGGNSSDSGRGIAVDSAGNAYVTGWTSSAQATFPEKIGPDLTKNGGFDAFVAKVNPSGTGLIYAGYIGGTGIDSGYGIAVDSAGNAYVTGDTTSTQATFPEKVGPDLTYNGGRDAFVAKVNPSGTGLVYAGYIGGSSVDEGHGIAVDSAGNAYVTGAATSTQATFPEKVGPDLTHNSGRDAFVAKVNPSGTGLVYAGYIGGTGHDDGHGIAVDSAGNAYVSGQTSSSQATFPEKVGPDLTHNGNSDAFVAKVTTGGTGLVYAGYIGGIPSDFGYGIAVDSAGNAYVTGQTPSDQASFPEKVGPDLTHNSGISDAFVAKVSP